MKGSTKSGINPVKLGGVGKGTSMANTGLKKFPAAKAKVSPNQHLNIKSRKVSNDGVYQDMAKKIHAKRGGPLMKRLLGVPK